MKEKHLDIVLVVLASPVLAAVAGVKAIRRVMRLRVAVQPQMECGTCGETIVLVGFWKCACGFTYRGHVLRICPVCGSFPRMIRCYTCGATEKVRI
jgi:hypothetical protein